MSLLHNLLRQKAAEANTIEANIAGLRSAGFYKIQLRNGAIVDGVPGPDDLKVGASVVVSLIRGGRHIILGSGYHNTSGIKTVSV